SATRQRTTTGPPSPAQATTDPQRSAVRLPSAPRGTTPDQPRTKADPATTHPGPARRERPPAERSLSCSARSSPCHERARRNLAADGGAADESRIARPHRAHTGADATATKDERRI